MSIAVRVSVWILGLLVVISAAVAVLALMRGQSLQGQNQNLTSQITADRSQLADLVSKTKALQDQSDQLTAKIAQAQQDKAQLQNQYDDLKSKSDQFQSKIDQANAERDDLRGRVDTLSRERDSLMQRLRSIPVAQPVMSSSVMSSPAMALPPQASDQNSDEYWASVLKQKAALQVQIEKAKVELDQSALQVVTLRKQNSDLQIQVKQLANDKDEIYQRIKYGQDLADNLSIDLARARNDQQAVGERDQRLKDENGQLLSEVRDLNATKLALERTVSSLSDQKDAMQKKLLDTESVIQNRIDDIWRLKASLDRRLAEDAPSASAAASATPGTDSMELPPIIVNAPNNANTDGQMPQQQQAAAAPVVPAPAPAPVPAAAPAPEAGAMETSASITAPSGKTEGTVISINESNNFVIVDLGQSNSSVVVGSPLAVYRDGSQIATLEVIQVRKDICAADIKDKSTELKVGDVVRFH